MGKTKTAYYVRPKVDMGGIKVAYIDSPIFRIKINIAKKIKAAAERRKVPESKECDGLLCEKSCCVQHHRSYIKELRKA